MFIILGFYKFKNLKSLKRQKKILENLFSENDIRGTNKIIDNIKK